ncbi:MAB_1171c family putative transporter [Streptomyces antimycoticus]|uniref:MAB_1171c family putative transporter n=1 Tax=Streptomyces antimycoticus TaxID=68175 RepID=UPI000A3AADCE|nr:MAB_1171c family putative transporter [Streptomyces antimycoticus]
MTDDVIALGIRLELPSVLLLWFAVLLRSPSGLRSAPQRGVWLAVATAAAAMTLDLPSVDAAATRHSGTNLVAVTRNILGVLSAGAVLYFVAQATTEVRRLKAALTLSVSAVVTILLSLGLAAEPHLRIVVPAAGPPAPSLLYWLVLISTHLGANTLCVLMCLRYSATSGSRSLTMSLRLFGLGTGLVGAFWLGYLVRVTTGGRWPMPWLQLLMDLHGVLRAIAILVPTFALFRRALSDIAVTWRLWPMWNDLVTVVPHVALVKPRHRIWDVLWPRVPYRMLAYRRIIETRDAILALTDYGSPSSSSHGRPPERHAASDLDAKTLADAVKSARNAKLQGSDPARPTEGLYSSGSRDLAGESAFLLRMAKAYRSASPHVDTNRQ